jgi:response regulator RpfG family c-di-GMP phosphodiesterase
MYETSRVRPRVLVADDEPEIRGVLTDLLEDAHDCVAVSSAEAALEALASRPFDLVVSDIMMPGMSGLELLPLVRERAPETVVIMISGVQSVESAIDALRAGAFDYIMKPFDLHHVEAAVSRALEHKNLRDAKRRYEAHLEEMVERRTAELNSAVASLEGAYRSTLRALTAALEARDHETHGHSERVVGFSLRLGRELGLTAEQLTSLEFGALLHDIGKIGVPDAILRKPAALDGMEWARMRMHPLYGRRILQGIDFLEGAARVVAEHHEQWDGSGYPAGLKGEAVDRNARIFAVADAFDAMTSDRVYRRGRPYGAAAEELDRCAGTQFDPEVVAAFRRVPQGDWDEIRRCSLAVQHEREDSIAGADEDVTAVRDFIEARVSMLVS